MKIFQSNINLFENPVNDLMDLNKLITLNNVFYLEFAAYFIFNNKNKNILLLCLLCYFIELYLNYCYNSKYYVYNITDVIFCLFFNIIKIIIFCNLFNNIKTKIVEKLKIFVKNTIREIQNEEPNQNEEYDSDDSDQ